MFLPFGGFDPTVKSALFVVLYFAHAHNASISALIHEKVM